MKSLLKFVCLTIIAFTGIFLCACGEVIVTPSISLESSNIELVIGDHNTQTKELDVFLENYGNGDARVHFSSDNTDLVIFTSEYVSGGRTKLTITGVQPGTASISIRSLQGGATKTITVKIVQPIENFSLKNEYLGKLYAIVGGALNLNSSYFYGFEPVNTTEKDLTFTIKTENSNCTIEKGVLKVGANCDLDKIAIIATSTQNPNISIEFEIKILKPITATLEYNYAGLTPVEVGNNTNNYLKIYTTDPEKNSAIAILTINAGNQTERLYIDKIFNDTNPQFLVSQTNYEFINGQHIYIYSIQSSENEAGKLDSLIFNISYENYTIGENDYIVSTKKLNISSYNSPNSIRVNDQIGTANIEIFENSSLGSSGKLLEFTVLPGFLEAGSDKIRIWSTSINDCPISLYKLNATRTAYICVYGYNSSGNFICTNTNFATTGSIPYLEINSGTKLYAFINSKYDSTDNRNTTFYAQSSIYYDQVLGDDEKALTQINFGINPNAQNIYLADLISGNIEKNDQTKINIIYGETITQYIAIDPSSFVIGSASRISLANNNLATLGTLTTVTTDEDYVYARFTIKSLQLGSTVLTITLSDGTTKNITLNIISPLEELDIDIEDLNDDVESDIIAFTSIIGSKVVVGEESSYKLNKISLVNSGSTIQFLKTATPSNGQYYVQYSFYDYNAQGISIENIALTKEALEDITWGQTSNILKVSSMNNFSVIEALNSKKEGNVLIKIDVFGMESDGEYSEDPVGIIYYLINFFIPVSGMSITNGTQTLYPYNAIGDLFVKDNGESKSFGTITVSVNSNNGSINPTYMNSLKIYVNGGFFPIEFTNDFCYLNEDGYVVYSEEDATLKIIKTLIGNVYTFNIQALRNVEQRYIFTFVVEEVNNRQFTGIARIFVKEVVEISDIELVNINKNDGIYFSNPDNTNEEMSLVIYTNLYSSDVREITNNRLVFETQWTAAYLNGVNILQETNFNQILRNLISISNVGDNGNYNLSIDKSFSGIGKIKIYPESNHFDGWNGEEPYYEIPILIADGASESTAIRIENETEFVNLLNNSNKYYILTNNLIIDCAGIINFAGKLDGNGCTISVKGPIFKNILSAGEVKNLNILALPSSQTVCKYASFDINGSITLNDVKTFGFLACFNEGTITDVTIEANTNFTVTAELINDPIETSTIIDAMGLLVGINKGTIQYSGNNEDEFDYDVYGTNSGLNGVGATYAGGIAGFNVGEIDGAHVAVTVTGTYVGNFAGNEGHDNDKNFGVIENCTYGLYDVLSMYINFTESSKEEKLYSKANATATAILYYYEVFGTLVNDQEISALKKINTFNFNRLLNISGVIETPAGAESDLIENLNYSLFNFTSSNKEIIDVVGNSLEIKGVGKVTLTITPKYSSTSQESSITIYVIYPISSYEIYEGVNAEASSNKIDNAEEIINVKKSNTHYFTTLLKSNVVLDYNLFSVTQNNFALSLALNYGEDLSEDFIISGITTNFEKDEEDPNYYFGTGTISIKAKESVIIGSHYNLIASLVLQNENQVLGNINSTDNLSDFTTISGMIRKAFVKNITINPIIGAEKIQGSIIGSEIDPSNVLSTNIILNTDDPNDNLIIEIVDKDKNIVWESTNHGEIFEVINNPKYEDLNNNKILFNILVYIQDNYRARITETRNYQIYIYAKSERSVYFVIDLVVKPQEIISVTYAHYNRDDSATENEFKIQNEPSSILAPGDNGLLVINLYPTYASYKRIEIESTLVNESYILMEQMYEENNSYFSANGNGYSNIRNGNKLTIYYSDAMTDDNGMVYIRTKLLNSVSEGLYFPLTITIFMEDENGVEKMVKTEQIILVSQLIDGATITINDTDEAVVVRGHDCEIKITVPIYQDLADYGILDKNVSVDIYDSIGIYFNKSEYEIVNNRKVYTGILSVGLNAELTGDGVFKVFTIVSRIINGRLESTYDTIEITVVDFLIEGIYIKGNDEDNNIFDTPLAIEKDLEFEFVLSDTPEYYDVDQIPAVERIRKAKEYFLENMAYKYESGNYSYIINTTRAFVKDFNVPTQPQGGTVADHLTHVVASQSPNSIAYSLYYTNSMIKYVNQTNGNEYVSIEYNADDDTSDFASNLLKVTGTKIGNIGLTIKIGYKLPGINEISYLIYNFVVQVQPYAEEDRPTPIYTEEEFIEYLSNESEENAKHNYILMENLTFTDYIPLESTYFSSLDGNNKIISIKSFGLVSNSNTLDVALFKEVTENVTLKNLTINFYELQDIIVNEERYNIINVAGLAIYNNGVIYNCEIVAIDLNNTGVHDADYGIKIYFDVNNKAKPKKDSTVVNIAGLVVTNDTNGCITNSRVGNINGASFKRVTGNSSSAIYETFAYHNLNIIGQGNITGFVLTNSGVISASFFSSGRIINYSVSGTEAITSGFVITNHMGAVINGCYSNGIKATTDYEIYITGDGITAQGIATGFLYENEGNVSDCYSNIKLAGTSAGRIVSGFVYNNRNNGLIERCYSASTIVGELTTQMPFTGNDAFGNSKQEVRNGLVNCYYIVRVYSEESVMEEKYSTGAVALPLLSLTYEKFYGFTFVSKEGAQDGSWDWNGTSANLVEANNIAISSRYIISNYDALLSSGQSTESINVFPYIKGYEYGSPNNPIIIRTADEYNRVFGQETSLTQGAYYAISQMYDKAKGVIFGSYRLVSHIDFNNLTNVENIKISSSIMNLTQKDNNKGSFDGNGLTISNVEITLNSRDIVGLISKLTNSSVFKNVNITVIKITAGTGVYVGGAIGLVENSFVSNVRVIPVNTTMGEEKSQVAGYNIVGGVIGFTIGNSRLSNLSSSISVTSLCKTSTQTYSRYKQTIADNRKLSYAGGIVGVIDIYKDFFNSGVYTSQFDVNKLKYYGKNVSVQGKYVGGVVGYVGISTYFADALFEITGLYNEAFNQKLISYGETIGGIVGVNYGKLYEIRIEHQFVTQQRIEENIKAYYDTTAFRGIATLFNALDTGNNLKYIGGLVGEMKNGELTSSYSKIDVVNKSSLYAGGLIGYNSASTTFYELFAFSDVESSNDNGYSGGLIGLNDNNIQFSLCVAMNFYNKNNGHLPKINEEIYNPSRLGALVGKNNDKSINIANNVFATNIFTIGDYEFDFYDVANKPTIEGSQKTQELTISNSNLAYFNKNVDVVTSNEMFINAGWDIAVWTKENDRLFPFFNFGISNQILYIEKPSDIANIFRFSNQSNTIIFGDDPNTLFNPYKYNSSDPGTWGEFSNEFDLFGLEVFENNIIFDISNVDFINNDATYFASFLATMYGEYEDWNYTIKGMEKTLFREIIGGTIQNISFAESILEDVPVLAETISYEATLIDLTFENINITDLDSESGSYMLGIVAKQMSKISKLENITIKDCSIDCSYVGNNTIYLGGIAGKIDNQGISNYQGYYKDININNLTITYNSSVNLDGTQGLIYAGLLFGEINYNAKYINCIISGDTNIININAGPEINNTTTIYAGGYVGYASSMLQTLINNSENLKFVDNLYILIDNCENLKAGLLFGEAVIASNGDGTTSTTKGELNIEISGLITNKYTLNGSSITTNSNPKSAIAEVGGVVGKGSGSICGVTVSGLFIDTNGDEVDDNYVLIDLQTKCKNLEDPDATDFGATEIVKVGGAVGNATISELYINLVDVYGDIIVSDTENENQLLVVGGVVGYTGNTYEIYRTNYKNNDYTSDIIIQGQGINTIVYAGGIVGYSNTTNTLGTFKIGNKEEGGNYSNGCTFEGNLEGNNVNKLYAGGIIGATSDGIGDSVINRIKIYDVLISGNIEMNSNIKLSSLIIGGVAGIVAADLENSYAWGNIKTNLVGVTIDNLYLGGIVGNLKGLSYQKSQFYSNYSMTSIYNIYRGETTHNVKSLIGSRSYVNVGDETNLSYYCHQINLSTDNIGENLYYYTDKSGDGTILSKFESRGLIEEDLDEGSKLNPQKINESNYASTTFDSGKYYVLYVLTDSSITTNVSKDIEGHLIGDGFNIIIDENINVSQTVTDATTETNIGLIDHYEYSNIITLNGTDYRIEYEVNYSGILIGFYNYSLQISELDSIGNPVGSPYTSSTSRIMIQTSTVSGLNYKFINEIILNGKSFKISIDATTIHMSYFSIGIAPFGEVSGYLSGFNVINNNRKTDKNAIGFALKNTGVVFACTALVKAYNSDVDPSNLTDSITRNIIDCGFITENTGLIADCGTVIFGSSAYSGFCEFNSGVIQNCYATGALTTGVNNQSETYSSGVFAGSSGTGAGNYNDKGKIVNCYVALKAESAGAAFYGANLSNCYYDRNAAEKDFGDSTDSIIKKNTSEISTLTEGTTTFIPQLGTNWNQKYYQNFGYPTLSVGAYEKFGYLCENLYTGNGEDSNKSKYIQIPNAGKLQQINNIYSTLSGILTVLNANYKLVNDVNLTGAGFNDWTPIGKNSLKYFSGKFDGQGYTISNLTITNSSVSNGYYGLFGYVKGASSTNKSEIKNINFTETNINITRSADIYTGAVVGYIANYGEINGCNNSGNISVGLTGTSTIDYTGGIIGYAINSAISNCTNIGNVTTNGGIVGYLCTGGIIGYAINSAISNCTNIGNVTTNRNYIGGIVGYLEVKNGTINIDNNSNSGRITGNSRVGGIVGYCSNSSSTTNLDYSANTGKIIGNSYLGGIVGQANSSVNINYCSSLGLEVIECTPLNGPGASNDAWSDRTLSDLGVSSTWPSVIIDQGNGVWDRWELYCMLGARIHPSDLGKDKNGNPRIYKGQTSLYPAYKPRFYINALTDIYVGRASGYGGNVTGGEYATISFDITIYSIDVKKTARSWYWDDEIKINVFSCHITNENLTSVNDKLLTGRNLQFVFGSDDDDDDDDDTINLTKTQLYLSGGSTKFWDTNPEEHVSLWLLEGKNENDEDGTKEEILNDIIICKNSGVNYIYLKKDNEEYLPWLFNH